MISATASFSQLYSLNFEKIKASSGNYLLQDPVVEYDARTNIAKVDLKKVQAGRNHLLTDRRNGRKLYMLTESDGRQMKVKGFVVLDPSGRWINLGNQTAGKGDPTFGCPDGWDWKIICYTHPTYNVQVCYTRCTPTQLTLELPSGL